MWMELLPIYFVLVEGIIVLIGGVYQLVTGKESLLMWKVKRKYNYKKYKKQFIKAYGILYLLLSAFCWVVLPLLYFYTTLKTTLFISIFIALLLGIGEYMVHRRYRDDLEKRKY